MTGEITHLFRGMSAVAHDKPAPNPQKITVLASIVPGKQAESVNGMEAELVLPNLSKQYGTRSIGYFRRLIKKSVMNVLAWCSTI